MKSRLVESFDNNSVDINKYKGLGYISDNYDSFYEEGNEPDFFALTKYIENEYIDYIDVVKFPDEDNYNIVIFNKFDKNDIPKIIKDSIIELTSQFNPTLDSAINDVEEFIKNLE